MTCPQHNDDNRGPLVCTRTDAHTTHVFVASSAPDLHDASEAAAELDR